MTYMCLSLQTLGRLVCLFVLALLFVARSSAQADLQIMVSGSWDYVVDPNPENDTNQGVSKQKRIILVSPLSANHGHGVYVFPGDDASKFPKYANSSLITKPGLYYLDVLGDRTFAGTPLPDEQPPSLYPPPYVAPALIKKVIGTADPTHPRVAISLPEPDYYSTYFGGYGSGMSQSKIAASHVTGKTPADYYTTWMVLHYYVKGRQDAAISGVPDDGTSFPATQPTFTSTGTDKRLGISIVMGANVNQNPNLRCDTLSSSSFTDSKMLWGNLSIYARFPEEDASGNQNPDRFHYECAEDVTMVLHVLGVGGADCHTAQFNINWAIP